VSAACFKGKLISRRHPRSGVGLSAGGMSAVALVAAAPTSVSWPTGAQFAGARWG
jgi:hypothetical protein